MIAATMMLASLLTLAGEPAEPHATIEKAHVFLFASVDCPISNRYAPEVIRLHERFAERGVRFSLVYADPSQNAAMIKTHLQEYGYPLSAFRDPQQRFAQKVGARVTPEAVVFDDERRLVYRGRIDDRYVDFGQRRREPTQRDLNDLLERLVADERLTLTETRAVGCYLPPID